MSTNAEALTMALVQHKPSDRAALGVVLIYAILGPPLGWLVIASQAFYYAHSKSIVILIIFISRSLLDYWPLVYLFGLVQAIVVSVVLLLYRARTGRAPLWVPLLAAAVLAVSFVTVPPLLFHWHALAIDVWPMVFAIHLIPAALCWAITKPLMR